MHHIAFASHTLHILILAHPFAYAIYPAEPDFEETPEQVPTEDTNPDPEQGKPWCI
jgi:hypothetical protein